MKSVSGSMLLLLAIFWVSKSTADSIAIEGPIVALSQVPAEYKIKHLGNTPSTIKLNGVIIGTSDENEFVINEATAE